MKFVDDRPDTRKAVKHEIPKMPEGYYSGDIPNPNLKKFVEDHMREHPYDPAMDDYNVPAFDKPIETKKATAIYNLHTYSSKKPHDAILQYIRHYTKPGDLVVDPFCGSGGTALAALMEGRSAIAIDRSPAATFITKNYCTPIDIRKIKFAFEQLKLKVEPEINWLYKTKCDRCGGDAITTYTVYSQVFRCPRCMELIPLFDCVEVTSHSESGNQKKISVCPFCYQRDHLEEIKTTMPRMGFFPSLFCYECSNVPSCKPRRATRRNSNKNPLKNTLPDSNKLSEIEKEEIPYQIPNDTMMHVEAGKPWGLLWRPYHEGFNLVTDFFTKRNLWAILSIKNAINSLEFDDSIKDFLLSGMTAVLQKSSRLMGYREDGIGRVMSGTYWLPPLQKDINVWFYIEEWFGDALRHLEEKNRILNQYERLQIMISTQSATDLSKIATESCDYIFTDPPYSWKVQFGEVNFMWEVFLEFDSDWQKEEIIVNDIREKSEADWEKQMQIALNECYRILKPNHWVSLCYHDTSEGTWALIQDIMTKSGFIPDKSESAIFIDADQKSIKQITADKSTKRDLVINFRKPRIGEATGTLTITGQEDSTTFSQKIITIIRDYLNTHPGATKDRIYDEVVSLMVRAGQMEAHNFEELLSRVADPIAQEGSTGIGLRWYLKETELNAVDSAETIKEDAAAEKVMKFITEFLKKHPENEGVHYSNIFEYYIYLVKDKPRRALVDWLLDYFYKTEEGTYRLPLTEEEEKIKKEGRAKGIARRIRHYIAYLEQRVPIREQDRPNDSTLVEWLRHCRRSGMYEQGKILYERGGIQIDRLSENQKVAVEEDYMVCIRNLARGAGKAPVVAKRKKKTDTIEI